MAQFGEMARRRAPRSGSVASSAGAAEDVDERINDTDPVGLPGEKPPRRVGEEGRHMSTENFGLVASSRCAGNWCLLCRVNTPPSYLPATYSGWTTRSVALWESGGPMAGEVGQEMFTRQVLAQGSPEHRSRERDPPAPRRRSRCFWPYF